MTPEDFIKGCNHVIRVYPDYAEKTLRKNANYLKKKLVINSPDSGSNHKNKLNESWSMKVEGFGTDVEADIWSKAPHFHLVDRGRVIKDRYGHVHGFKQGTHFLKKTVDRTETEIMFNLEKDIAKKVDDGIG